MDTKLGTVSIWIARAKTGDDFALADLHQRYWDDLVTLARKRLKRAPVADRDAEDVAQDAFIVMYESMQAGKIPRLKNRQQWIAFLTHIIACRTVNEYKRSTAMKRGGGKLIDMDTSTLNEIDAKDSPELRAIVNDCYDHYLRQLPDHLREFAELHLAGLTSTEIADQLGCVRRTVERKLQVLKLYWAEIAESHFEAEREADKRESEGQR